MSSAREILDQLGLINQPIVALAKQFEEVFTPESTKPVIFPAGSQALFVFQNIRDEAHRFAINYHRKLRENQAVKSLLDDIPQMSVGKKKILFEHYGDLKGIMAANEGELARLIGKNLARRLRRFLHENLGAV